MKFNKNCVYCKHFYRGKNCKRCYFRYLWLNSGSILAQLSFKNPETPFGKLGKPMYVNLSKPLRVNLIN